MCRYSLSLVFNERARLNGNKTIVVTSTHIGHFASMHALMSLPPVAYLEPFGQNIPMVLAYNLSTATCAETG